MSKIKDQKDSSLILPWKDFW